MKTARFYETDHVPGYSPPRFDRDKVYFDEPRVKTIPVGPRKYNKTFLFTLGGLVAGFFLGALVFAPGVKDSPRQLPQEPTYSPPVIEQGHPIDAVRAPLVSLPPQTRVLWQGLKPYGDFWFTVKGTLQRVKDLPAQAQIGDAYIIGEHYWVWCQPQGYAMPLWVDP